MLRNILYYENCKCRKKLFDKLVKECIESIDENELISVTLNDYESVCWSCTVYITLFFIAFLIMIGISSAFIYFHWYLKQSYTGIVSINPGTEIVIDYTYKWEPSSKLSLKNRTNYFFNEIINIKNFDSNLIKIDKKPYKNIGICYVGNITIKNTGDYDNIHSVNRLYFIIGKVDRYIDESDGNKYLVLASTDENKELNKVQSKHNFGVKWQ